MPTLSRVYSILPALVVPWCAALLFVAAPAPAANLAEMDKPADEQAMQALVESISRSIKAHSDAPQPYVERGIAYFKLHKFDLAIADFSHAIALDDRQDDAYFARGMARGRNGEIDQGIADLGVYIQRHPRSSLAYTKSGVRHLWKKDLDGAEHDLRRAVELDPDNAEAHDDLGVVYAQRGDYARAMRHFSATVRLDPSYQKGYHNLAVTYYLVGLDTQALAAVNESLRLASENRNSLILKSEILKALGRLDEAKRVREDADFAPDGNWSEQVPLHPGNAGAGTSEKAE